VILIVNILYIFSDKCLRLIGGYKLTGVLLTQYQGTFIGPVAWVLGKLMDGVFILLNAIGIPNTGLAIIIFTFVIYMCLMPLTIKQQKFSKLQVKMAPELKVIQDKYKGRKDQDAMVAQQEEMKAVYGKYGVSQTGSCVQLIIQMPILFALYRVIDSIPAYVTSVKDVFVELANKLIVTSGSADFMQTLSGASRYSKQFSNASFTAGTVNDYTTNTYIDVLNKASSADWQSLSSKFPELSSLVDSTHAHVVSLNNFLGLNIGDSPSYLLHNAMSAKSVLLIIAAISVPVLAALTQWINVKLMPQQAPSSNDPNDQAAQMANTMKSMNTIMPLMSAFFCFTLPAGMGFYWIAGSVVRSIQQVFINKHIDRMDLDAEIAKNQEKYQKKLEKMQERTPNINQYAKYNTRNLSAMANTNVADSFSDETKNKMTEQEKTEALSKANSYYESGKARKTSLLSKANMVRDFDEKNK